MGNNIYMCINLYMGNSAGTYACVGGLHLQHVPGQDNQSLVPAFDFVPFTRSVLDLCVCACLYMYV